MVQVISKRNTTSEESPPLLNLELHYVICLGFGFYVFTEEQ